MIKLLLLKILIKKYILASIFYFIAMLTLCFSGLGGTRRAHGEYTYLHAGKTLLHIKKTDRQGPSVSL